ncbi:uncharacterized protein LOC105698699 [Orussus abietinus]|uniref:uncharacterized protein LOC105698699 n=1 Tax=Orussus abietinus TaxID=222816 RepID=UPI0006253149|nr:uncharacterized protein LOC105698699 [Orussus abietinus]
MCSDRRESNGDRDREAEDGDDYEEDGDGAARALAGPKSDHWNGYYDFLINEGSYKFWAVFQLATAALLIYSGFAALYYAKVNPPNADDYEDYFLRRRRSAPAEASLFLGLGPEAFQRILEAVERES